MRNHCLRFAFSLVELLVVVAIIGVLLAILMPAVQKVRDAANRTRCANAQAQVGKALYHYHDVHGVLPPALDDSPPPPSGTNIYWYWSWMARLLPYIEQENLFKEAEAHAKAGYYDPWGSTTQPPNPALNKPMYVFQCPSDTRVLVSNDVPIYPGSSVTLSLALTTFLGVNGTDLSALDGVFYWKSKVRFSQITDGSSHTLFVAERPPSSDMSFGWWFAGTGQKWDIFGASNPEPTGSGDVVLGVREFNVGYYAQPPNNCPKGQANPYEFKPGNLNDPCDTFHFWSLHPNGANFLMGDGSVRFLPYTAAQILPALATRDKGETVTLP